jgi:micrococcal nuclease
LVVVVLAAVRFWPELDRVLKPEPPIDPSIADREYLVQRVVDGDTLLLANGDRVRLLGVDTPETVAPDRPVEPFGKAASEFTRRHVERRRIRLGFDKERVDRYGRVLAYVYLEDGTMLNEELIRAGLSEAQLQYPYSAAMKRRFRAAESEAREAERGLWTQQFVEPHSHFDGHRAA